MAELTRRYIVMAMATEGPFDPRDPDVPFVLKPWKDPAALRALVAYRAHCYPELGAEIDAWIREIESGPLIRGGVGSRNEQHLATRPEADSARRDGGRTRRTVHATAKATALSARGRPVKAKATALRARGRPVKAKATALRARGRSATAKATALRARGRPATAKATTLKAGGRTATGTKLGARRRRGKRRA